MMLPATLAVDGRVHKLLSLACAGGPSAGCPLPGSPVPGQQSQSTQLRRCQRQAGRASLMVSLTMLQLLSAHHPTYAYAYYWEQFGSELGRSSCSPLLTGELGPEWSDVFSPFSLLLLLLPRRRLLKPSNPQQLMLHRLATAHLRSPLRSRDISDLP